ncbi:MAG TPA: hypothetical protein VMW87_04525 [Spirochaetia bacterium]|nr:hypothetical protein [Spirochaetia bacterium]
MAGRVIDIPNPLGGVIPIQQVARIGQVESQATGGAAFSLGLKSGSTGLTGLVAAAPIFSLRWASLTTNALITLFRWQFVVTTVATVAGLLDSALSVARGFTVADTSGVAVTLSGNDQKKRTAYPSTGMAMRVAQTAALTAGTRTLDDNPVANDAAWLATTTLGPTADILPGLPPRFDPRQEGILLAANEGLVLALIAAMPASVVAQLYVNIEWKEIPIGAY